VRAGVVNGLAVAALGDYEFGHPVRVTATVAAGDGELVDVNRESKLGGPVHTKGFLILAGYLRDRFSRDTPLALSASLVFEQSYEEVEGDSAAAAELFALLSALADARVRQGVAVTGSVNQHGQIQPIGAVNAKVEGFFDVCRQHGLSGDQGVVIPAGNVQHLMLRQDVLDAVEAGSFHVWAIDTVEQGIELLTGLPAGERGPDGAYREGSVNRRIADRLAELAELARLFRGPSPS
jgi:predicted ATP-dependent protease